MKNILFKKYIHIPRKKFLYKIQYYVHFLKNELVISWPVPSLQELSHTVIELQIQNCICYVFEFSSDCVCVCIQSLSCVQILASPWTVAHQASFTVSEMLVKLMSIESVMPSNRLILCYPLLLPSIFSSIRVSSNELVLCIRCQSIRASASAPVLPMNIQG